MTDFQRWCIGYLERNGDYTPSLQNPVFLEIFTKEERDDITWRHASMFILGCCSGLKEQLEDDKKPSQAANEFYFLSKTHADLTEKFWSYGIKVN